jgi:hypothetical protein
MESFCVLDELIPDFLKILLFLNPEHAGGEHAGGAGSPDASRDSGTACPMGGTDVSGPGPKGQRVK